MFKSNKCQVVLTTMQFKNTLVTIIQAGFKVLNSQSPIPLYQQLAAQLRHDIENGVLQADDRIPSENELAQQLHIGRPTVRQATDLLVREGVLQRRRGSGTYVLPPGRRIDLFSLAGTSAALGQSQLSNEVEIVRPVSRHEPGDCGPEVMAEQSLYRFDRLTRIDGAPVLLEQFYLDAEHFPDFELVALEDVSLARVVRENYFLEPTSAEQTFAIVSHLPGVADWLQVDAQVPLLHVNRNLHFGLLSHAIVCDLYCRTDRFQFSQTITTPELQRKELNYA